MASKPTFKQCFPPCWRYITGGDTHELCVVCLGVKHAQSALERTDCVHCKRLPRQTLRSRLVLVNERAAARVTYGSSPALAEAGWQLGSRGLVEGFETGSAFSQPSIARSSTSFQEPEACSTAALSESPMLRLSSSRVVDMLCVGTEEIENSPPSSTAYKELVEVVTRAVDKLNIEWPVERQDVRQRSKLDERFLPSRVQLPPRLPFFHDLHSELSRSWKRPFSARIYSPEVLNYSSILGLHEHGYGMMPSVEETLRSLSPDSAMSLRAPPLPTRPCRTTSALVSKAYMAAGQAGACLHTMAILQAYQADLLKDLDKEEVVGTDTIKELRRAADLSLRATKETARAIGRSMAALVATERHLWLNLLDLKEKEKSSFLDAPLTPPGLFGDAVTSVIERFQEATKQEVAFQRFLPCHAQVPGAAEWEKPQPSTSSSCTAQQRLSVASRAPPPKKWGSGRHCQSKLSKGRMDQRAYIITKKATTKRT